MRAARATACAVACAAIVFVASPASRAADEYPLRDLVECSPRGGMSNFFAKLTDRRERTDIKIAYLGGSNTSANGWRVLSREWFQRRYPSARVSEVNAGIGGTGSDLGVFRLHNDVLRHEPDLLFLEFAGNDQNRRPHEIKQTYEGIVRKTWTALPDCDICFIYTFKHNDVELARRGKMKRSASVMEEVADHYDIPSIHMGLVVSKLEREGKLVMKTRWQKTGRVSGPEFGTARGIPLNPDGRIPYSGDGVHPYASTGHQLFLNAMVRSWPRILARGKPGRHRLGSPLVRDNWAAARMIPLERAERVGPWRKLEASTDEIARKFGARSPSIWKGAPGATLRFRFKGTQAAMYHFLGPGCGYVRVTIDGRTRERRCIDPYCTYYRLAILGIASGLPDGEHTVEITVLDKRFDKKKVLFTKNHAYYEKHPEKYAHTDWYAAAVFVIGDIVD